MKKFIFRKIFLLLFLILNVSGQFKEIEDIVEQADSETFLLSRFFKKEFILTREICRGGEKIGCPVEIFTRNGKVERFKLAYISNKNEPSKGFSENFIRECSFLCKFDHPNIVKLWAGYPDELVMYQELASSDLLKYISTIRKIKDKIKKQKRIFNIINQITEGLNFLHENRYIHGDLKSSNVVVFFGEKTSRMKKKPFRVALIDFSRTYQIPEDRTSLKLDIIFTTPLFSSNSMVKEFYESKECIYDFKDDIYSLGMIIYELIYHDNVNIYDQADCFLLNLDEKYKNLKYRKTSIEKPKKQKILLDNHWKPEIKESEDPYYNFFNKLIIRCLDIKRGIRPSSREILDQLAIFKKEYFGDINIPFGYDPLFSSRINSQKNREFQPFKI